MDTFIERWIRIINERGNAGILARENIDDLKIIEKSCAMEWAAAVNAVWDTKLGAVLTNSDDPPDCLVQYKGKQIGLEITELVDGKFFAKRRHERANGREYNSHHGQGFLDAQWNITKFRKLLLSTISKKTAKYEGRGLKVDVLLVVSAENWLAPANVGQWIDQISVETSTVFQSIYFLMDYRPSYSEEHWPVFKIYGGL